ncbi:MAG TPA: ATP-binding protein [Oligoflexus sp.]|uniref:hybrid sensor histidine kinase/response regulator n=1 Tax=Oligoflexus sp. TaxID=1971216 RepID=UPI002D53DDD6|nr:ATP-binding protein [Oligoflexus sp.]HYX39558.1 ATP-binding protein [Oligoflexus sp.]
MLQTNLDQVSLSSCRILIVTLHDLRSESVFLQAVRTICADEKRWEFDIVFGLEPCLGRLASRCYDTVLLDSSESLNFKDYLSAIHERQPTVAALVYVSATTQLDYSNSFGSGLQDFLTDAHLSSGLLKSSIINACARQRVVSSLKSKSALLQRRLEDQVGYLRKVIIGSHDGVIIIDQQGIVCLANSAAMELFDKNGGEFIGSYFGYPLTNDRTIELTIESRKRGPITAEMRVTRIEWDNRLAYLASIHDVSRYKNQAITFKAAEEAALRSSQLKSEFLANMSHEIRTPLNGVLGMVQLLNLTKLEPYQQELLRTVQASGDHLLVLINDILDMSKVEAGKLILETKAFEIENLVREAMAIHAPAANSKRVGLFAAVAPGVPKTICGDQVRLRQVLSNLVGNAVKFTDTGDVTLRVSVSASATENYCIIGFEVSDTGVGIPNERLSELFQPFNQVHADTTKGGTGLGLSISKRLVNLMKGEISVRSELGKGSDFRCDIPFDSSAPNTPERELSSLCTVQLISLSPHRKSILCRELQWAGINVEANSGLDIVIIDLCSESSSRQKELVAARDEFLKKGHSVIQLCFINDPTTDETRHSRLWIINVPVYLGDVVSLVRQIRDGATAFSHDFPKGSPREELREIPLHQACFSGKILIAEDNIVNQQVAVRFLHHLGVKTECVTNGQQAVEAFNDREFSAILMDYRMPVLDGIQATMMIRALEAGKTRIPIIALTANAQEADRDACIAAGMDGFLTKPLRIAELQTELARVLPMDFNPSHDFKQPNSSDEELLDDEVIQDLLMMGEKDNDPDFPFELFSLYLDISASRLKEIRQSFLIRDLESLKSHTHSLKGSSANIGALRLTECCRTVERLGLSDIRSTEVVLDGMEQIYNETVAKLMQVIPSLPDWIASKTESNPSTIR